MGMKIDFFFFFLEGNLLFIDTSMNQLSVNKYMKSGTPNEPHISVTITSPFLCTPIISLLFLFIFISIFILPTIRVAIQVRIRHNDAIQKCNLSIQSRSRSQYTPNLD